MTVHYKEKWNVSAIEFCCKDMAEDILLQRVITTPWTDHDLNFFITPTVGKFYRIQHCPHCGTSIKHIRKT